MNAVAKIDQQPGKLMLLDYMADKYSLTPDEFRKTVRATCGLSTATPEQVAAFLIVAKEYNLNPLTKEIYAFPGRGGGIVPIVSIDGWVNLVNSHRACDGFEFEMEHDAEGKLVSCTCRMFRKDRSHPVAVTEYLSECIRATEPWKMQHRMLRHKAMIQAARYAFGFSGIYDEDEGAKIAEMRDVTPRDEPPAPPQAQVTHQPKPAIEPEIITVEAKQPPHDDPESTLQWIKETLAAIAKPDDLEPIWNDQIAPRVDGMFPPDQEVALGYFRTAEARLAP